MQQPLPQRSMVAPAVIGVLLVVVGVIALIVREADVNLLPGLGTWGWPLFVLVPGLVMLGAGVLLPAPRGAGLAVAGSVVTTLGALLFYQSQSGHWESWAYAWALLPGAAGAGLLGYGVLARERGMRTTGTWLLGIAAVVFLAGAWFFEGLFAGEDRPVDLGNWWPIGVIILGAALALWAFLRPAIDVRTHGSDRQEPRPL
ncbi:MAG TPA: hypothetical protein VHL56_00630 [Candidatus Limnocylindrales bacterium]|nr:hypothetical protein [Candidatus Limnocylindrales bacterium]